MIGDKLFDNRIMEGAAVETRFNTSSFWISAKRNASERMEIMGYIKGDCLMGTVSGTTAKGVNVSIEGTNDKAFCQCNLAPGDIASFTIRSWVTNACGTSVKLELDSVISYADNVIGHNEAA